eukprot:scaffold10117_cov111-Isochrysis_galbana.AAC.1
MVAPNTRVGAGRRKVGASSAQESAPGRRGVGAGSAQAQVGASAARPGLCASVVTRHVRKPHSVLFHFL